MDADRGLQVRHVVLEAGVDDLVMLVALVAEAAPRIDAHSVQRENLDALDRLSGVRNHHSAFAGDDVLRDIETETAERTESSDCSALPFCFDCVCAILDDGETVLP